MSQLSLDILLSPWIDTGNDSMSVSVLFCGFGRRYGKSNVHVIIYGAVYSMPSASNVIPLATHVKKTRMNG